MDPKKPDTTDEGFSSSGDSGSSSNSGSGSSSSSSSDGESMQPLSSKTMAGNPHVSLFHLDVVDKRETFFVPSRC